MKYRSNKTQLPFPTLAWNRIFRSFRQWLIWGTIASMALMVAEDRSARAAPTVTRDSGDKFFVDVSKMPYLRGNYAVYKIKNDSTPRNNVWVKLDMPAYTSTASVSLGEYEDGLAQIGAMAANETKTVFFYLYSGLTPANGKSIKITDTHKVVVYEGNPNRAGATQLTSTPPSFSFTFIEESLDANANKVNIVQTTSNPQLGGVVEVKITSANTGNTGAEDSIFLSPASLPDWLANKFELFSTTLQFGTSTPYEDKLLITNPSVTGAYTATFKFRAVGTTTSATTVSPTMHISSGNQIKHSPLGSSSTFPPIPAVSSSNLTLQKLVNTTQMTSGGTVTYTLRLTNTGTQEVAIQDFVDTLPTTPASTTYQTGTAKFNNIAIANPITSGSQLIWGGRFVVPAGQSRDLTYNVTIPNTEGVYTNKATAYIGDVKIDTTATTADDAPATATVQVAPLRISGTVFEDVNYGGGAGRNLTTAQNSAVASGFATIDPNSSTENNIGSAGVRVELYSSDNTLLAHTTTNQDGAYKFDENSFSGGLQPNTTYKVRVVDNSTNRLNSKRTTSGITNAPLSDIPIAVQTFRTNADTGTVVAVTNEVGGASTTATGDGANSTLTGALSVATVKTTAAGVSGIDFGFNFDTIVNTNDTGRGSLQQFIINSNVLANANLNQDANSSPAAGTIAIDSPAGEETSIFMIPSSRLTSGVADINLTSLLPPIKDARTAIDGRTQTVNIGNTNNIDLGAGGTVGVDALPLSRLNGPEVQLRGPNSLTAGLDIQGNNIRIEGMAIYGFGTVKTTNANINIGSTMLDPLVKGNVIGTTAKSFTDVGASRSGAYGIYTTSTSGIFSNNLIGYHGRGGIEVITSTKGISTKIENNEIRNNAIEDSKAEGTNIGGGGGGVRVRGNLFIANGGPGIDAAASDGGNTYENNTVTKNGSNIINEADPQTSGIRMTGSGNKIDRNIIFENYGAGILIRSTATNNLITKNSIYGNGTQGSTPSKQIGIDLLANGENIHSGNTAGGKSPVTLNDGTLTANGGNGLLDYPVFAAAINGNNLVLSGYARPSAAIEFFIADGDPSGFGEGKTYLKTLVEGSSDDLDGGTGGYTGSIGGIAQGSDANANKFRFTIPLASLAGVTLGTKITATATIGNATSEFSGATTVASSANLILIKRIVGINGNRAKNPNDNTVLNTVRDNPATDNDTHPNWPNNFLLGAYDAGKVKPGDEIEYAVYFMNASGAGAKDVKICDRVVGSQSFINDAYGAGKDIEYQLGANPLRHLTRSVDASVDRARFDSSTAAIPGCVAPTITGTNNGTVVIDITGTNSSVQDNTTTIPGATAPGTVNSYGYFRFKTKVTGQTP